MVAYPSVRASGRGPRELLELAYAEHAGFVRRRLSSLGIGGQDLDDACHDVFVIAIRKLPVLNPAELRAWLEDVTRKVIAGRRRRASHRRERLTEAPELPAELVSELPNPSIRDERATLVRLALARLPPSEQDALALHAVGELPLASVARLLERDPKTARARIRSAKRRLACWLEVLETPRTATARPSGTVDVREEVRAAQRPRPRSVACTRSDGRFEVIADDSDKSVGLVNNALVAVWRSKVTQGDVDILERNARRLRASRAGPLAYVTVVERGWQPPDARTRERMVSLLRAFREDLVLHANIVPESTPRLARPMISALGFLAGHETPTAFFPDPEALSAVVASSGATAPCAAALLSALRQLRARSA